ncbi:uncharacterized protein LOC136041922 [Artemia franciscana]|uniref:uncharacterized protein LOC136041922 n=1 Tax=Artemia franciscana TaxID=6661 RepID=UPI0032DA72A4
MIFSIVFAASVVLSELGSTTADLKVVSPYHDLAVRFAPRIRFDQQTGTDIGKCLPSNAEDYYKLRKGGFTGRICNMDYISVLENRIPTYYFAEQCGENYYFSYWLFYGYKDDCPLGESGGDVSWVQFNVKATNNGTTLDRVVFYQHSGWYTRNPGHYKLVDETHPVAFAGKIRHGHYHDDGGSGTCCYFEDYRNTGSANKAIDTWQNLVWLRTDETALEWMMDNTEYIWNGVNLPTFRNIDLCNLKGCKGSYLQVCSTCGCAKTDVDDDKIV